MHDFCVRKSIIFEAEFKKALARESGAQGVLFDEKTEGRKSRDNVPLEAIKNLLSRILLYKACCHWFLKDWDEFCCSYMNQFLDINQFLYRIKKSNQFYIK
jgi:hypothetical protein